MQPDGSRNLLVLDAAYSLRAVRSRGLEYSVTSRDLNGWFNHVWSVHPLLGADPIDIDAQAAQIQTTELAPRHTIIEASVSGHRRHAQALYFLIVQIRLLYRISRIIRRGGISVIRAGDPYYLGLLGLFMARLHRIPLLIRINGNYDEAFEAVGAMAYPRLFRRRWIEKLIERFILRRADLVVGANQNNLAFAIANGANPERTTVFRYGALIDPVHFAEPDNRPPPSGALAPLVGRPYVVCVSRLEEVKIPQDVIEVLFRVRARCPEVLAVLVGDGSMRKELELLAASLGVSEHVIFAGNLSQSEVADVLAHATVVLSPMTGRALVEASLAGRPIVAYEIEWHGELLRDHENGRLVPYRNVDAMSSVVCDLINDPSEANRLGQQGRLSALVAMNPADLIRHEQETYGRLLDLHQSPS